MARMEVARKLEADGDLAGALREYLHCFDHGLTEDSAFAATRSPRCARGSRMWGRRRVERGGVGRTADQRARRRGGFQSGGNPQAASTLAT